MVVRGTRGYRVRGSGGVHKSRRTRKPIRRDRGQRRHQLAQRVDDRPYDAEYRADWIVAGGHVVVPVTRVVPDFVAATDARHRYKRTIRRGAAPVRVTDRRLGKGNSGTRRRRRGAVVYRNCLTPGGDL